MTLVSIILSAFNAEKSLPEALESLLAQSHAEWECVACDDGSTDGTWKILSEYAAAHPARFVLLRNVRNLGLAYSLNRCLKACSGDYVARMDADDISEPGRLSRELAFLEAHPECALVGSQMRRFDECGASSIVSPPEHPTQRDLVGRVPFFHATIMMRRSAYEALGGYDATIRRAEDNDLWFRFFALGFRGGNIQAPLYRYRENLATVKRRSIASRWELMRVQLRGYRQAGFPWWAYLWSVLNFMKAFVPSRCILLYRRWRCGRNIRQA